jgi:hypothetical protein
MDARRRQSGAAGSDDMTADGQPPTLEGPAAALYDAIEAVIEPWLERLVVETARRRSGEVPAAVSAAARRSAASTAPEVLRRIRALLVADVDEQRTNPLGILRGAVAGPTAVLRDAGVAPARRDDFEHHAFPDDVYGLSPATWRDVDESLHEPGIEWGAWKAGVVLARRRAEGRR